jgi:uncharacterized protein YkwD
MVTVRHTIWLVILLAGTGSAQWHTIGKQSVLARDMLDAHNAVRAQLKLPPLMWSDRLAERAQDWANTLLARKQFSHRPNSPYGENLFEITGAPATSAQVVTAWANEVRDYDYQSNTCRGVCGHYTQIVWRNTKEVGCAVARGGGREVWVCNYSPPGNFIGERPY